MSQYIGTGPSEVGKWLSSDSWRSFDAPFLVLWGGRYLPAMSKGGQGYRWFSSILIHGNAVHILVNSAIFLWLGSVLEYHYGIIRVLIVAWASGLGGNFVSAVIEDPCAVVIGFSGAIFGLLAFNLG